LFLLPMMAFVKRLKHVKLAALSRYSTTATSGLTRYEGIYPASGETHTVDHSEELPAMEDLGICFENASRMRTMPVDMKSIAQMVGAAAGPMAPIILKFLPLSEEAKESLGKFFGM
jgi:hypothetical protein